MYVQDAHGEGKWQYGPGMAAGAPIGPVQSPGVYPPVKELDDFELELEVVWTVVVVDLADVAEVELEVAVLDEVRDDDAKDVLEDGETETSVVVEVFEVLAAVVELDDLTVEVEVVDRVLDVELEVVVEVQAALPGTQADDVDP